MSEEMLETQYIPKTESQFPVGFFSEQDLWDDATLVKPKVSQELTQQEEPIDVLATEKQIDMLKKHGFNPPLWFTKVQASEAIGSIPINQKQAELLCAYGFDVLNIPVNKRMSKWMFDRAEKRGVKPNWEMLNKHKDEIASKYK